MGEVRVCGAGVRCAVSFAHIRFQLRQARHAREVRRTRIKTATAEYLLAVILRWAAKAYL